MTVIALLFLASNVSAQQITVNRIEQMPNLPQPYQMRNWKQVALGYDSLVFDFYRTGQGLPLVWLNTNTVNYPSHNSFGLHTVVGTTDPGSTEAINTIPAVVGASLAGVDKSNQNGHNWVLMCEEYFNRRAAENVYLNHPSNTSGDDWWYDTMPNVFFYELYSMYPGTGDFNYQFTTIADRWLQAVKAMGGSAAPWHAPNMDHRAWSLSTMKPNDDGVHEPEASGAIAWLLYNAFVRTDDAKYRMGAEWAMEFLNGLSRNPAYELQLSYGTYTAARINAELGTTYDIAKLVNWCFDVGPLRQWGAIIGKWGSYDCSGLIGEVNGSNDYAFIMNTFEQAGMLVPMVRYDDRFARAIGKWMLNAANAARLLYPNYLPDQNQDSEEWSHQYDPQSTIAHEALRQSGGGVSPYATGDAISGGWGATNLALYGSSHVGILAGIIDTTNVPGILRLDVLKTDYFHDRAYPTYLYFNPDSVQHTVAVDVGTGTHDLYDAVTNSFVLSAAAGSTAFTISANSAALIVVTPSGGSITYDFDRMLVDGVVVDYRSGQTVLNYPPRIKSLAPDSSVVIVMNNIQVYCTATDRNSDSLNYSWNVSRGMITGSGAYITWTAPDSAGAASIVCVVSDGHGGQAVDTTVIQVVRSINHAPIIRRIRATPRKIDVRTSAVLTCAASDPDSDAFSYTWSTRSGTLNGSGSTVTWAAPAVEGNYYVSCLVDDGRGAQALDSIGLEVRDFSNVQMGQLIAFYPFNGNAEDASGNNHNGIVSGTTPVSDRFGRASSAFSFDGLSSWVKIPNDSTLNFQNAIAINFWIKISAYYNSREQYPLSHGNWQNRWKVSITPNSNTLRWTVKTTAGTKDLDSETQLVRDSLYNITAIYSGSDIEVYINGALDAFSSFSGAISRTTYDLTMGQDLPGDNSYNFNGVLDDIRIYNYALSVAQISSLFDLSTSVEHSFRHADAAQVKLDQNFPNPFNPSTKIAFFIPKQSYAVLKIFDVLGREIDELFSGEADAGSHTLVWHAEDRASGMYFYKLQTGSTFQVKTMLLIR